MRSPHMATAKHITKLQEEYVKANAEEHEEVQKKHKAELESTEHELQHAPTDLRFARDATVLAEQDTEEKFSRTCKLNSNLNV
jgi:hypothetical protein